jgi:hypothetical protein
MAYASNTGTRRNLAVMKAHGWRILISAKGDLSTRGFQYALDNGAWSAFQQGHPFDVPAFEKALARVGKDADWTVVPDVVQGGGDSLRFSMEWLPRVLGVSRMALVAVQDGMTEDDLAPLVSARVGVFLGGSTEWKLATMESWGHFCAKMGCHYHVARVNTARRIRLAQAAGADSIDGSSVSRYAVTMPRLEHAVRQADLFAPKRVA